MRDIRFGLRVIRRNPGVSSVAIISIVVAITLNAVIFSLVDWLWLRPAPYDSPREVIRLFASSDRSTYGSFSWPDYEDIRDGMRSLSGLAAVQHRGASLFGGEYSVQLLADVVSRNFFDVVGAGALIGNVFSEDDPERMRSEPLVVISHSLWQRHFGSDPGIIGRSIRLTGRSVTVMGVAPSSFYGINRMVPIDVWFPVETWGNPDERTSRTFRDFHLIGRLEPGTEPAAAEAEAEAIVRRLELSDLSSQQAQRALIVTERQFQSQRSSTIGVLLLAIVGAILLIICANVSALLLARSMSRQREMAIRLSVGGNQFDIVRQLLTEGMLLSFVAVGVSLLVTHGVLKLLPALMPPTPAYVEWGFALDGRTVGFALVLSVFTTLLTGLFPALNAARPDLIPVLKGEAAFTGQRWGRFGNLNLLVIAQLALVFTLVSSTGLLSRSFVRLYSSDKGFGRTDIILAAIYPPGGREATGPFCLELLDRVRSLPGVETASIARHVPFFPSGGGATRRVFVPESGEGWEETGLAVKFNIVEQEYFRTLEIPVLQGRAFTGSDDERGPPVMIVNETMARRYWPDENPLGKTVILNSPTDRAFEVVGVVPDGKYNWIEEPPEPYFYLPFGQLAWWDYLLLVGATGDQTAVVEAVRREIRNLSGSIDIFPMTTLRQIVRDTTYEREIIMWLVLFFACLGVLLSGVGLFGVISFAVSRRTHEIGVRMALGADHKDIRRMVLHQGGRLCLWGLTIGLPLAVIAGLLMRNLLFGVRPFDAVSFGLALVVLIGITLVAATLPGRRASVIDPLVAIRYE